MASSTDLFTMEAISKFDDVNLPAVILEHMHKIINARDGRHGMSYGYFLARVFDHFKVPLGLGVRGTIKQNLIALSLNVNVWKGRLVN